MNIFQWKHPAAKWAALGFVLLFTALFVNQCLAAEYYVMGGVATGNSANVARSYNSGVVETGINTEDHHWEVAAGYIGPQYSGTPYEISRYVYGSVQYLAGINFEGLRPYLGLGVMYRSEADRVEALLPSALNFSLSAGVDIHRHWRIQVRHFSNAGTREPNRGQNLLLLGYRF